MREEVRSRWWYVAAFLLCGIAKYSQAVYWPFVSDVQMDVYPFTHLTIIICAVICIGWTISIRSHILQREIRRLLTGVGLCMIFYTMVQFGRYKFFNFPETVFLKRYCRYLYYLPTTMIPLLLYFCALKTAGTGKKRTKFFLLAVWSILNILMLTNDYLGLAFSRLTKEGEDSIYLNYRGVSLLCFIWDGVLLAGTFFVLYRSSRSRTVKKKFWRPVAWLLAGFLLFLLNAVIPGHPVENFFYTTVVYDAMIIAFCESCIAIGLLPSNFGYFEIFKASSLSAQIIDGTGKVALKSMGAKKLPPKILNRRDGSPVMLDADTRLMGQPITGGYVYWTEDVSEMNKMYASLKETADDLAETGLLFQAENELKEERIHLETQRQLYDSIGAAARWQLLQVSDLLERAREYPEEQEQIICKAMVPLVYVKRLANLMMLSEQRKEISLLELKASITESMKYLAYQKVSGMVQGTSDRSVSSELVICLYRFFQFLLESSLPDLSGVIVHIKDEREKPEVIFMLGTSSVIPDMEIWEKNFAENHASLNLKEAEEMLSFQVALPEDKQDGKQKKEKAFQKGGSTV